MNVCPTCGRSASKRFDVQNKVQYRDGDEAELATKPCNDPFHDLADLVLEFAQWYGDCVDGGETRDVKDMIPVFFSQMESVKMIYCKDEPLVYEWFSVSVCVKCSCGKEVILIDEPKTCSCGKQYEIRTSVREVTRKDQ